jgi:hypothetical protein
MNKKDDFDQRLPDEQTDTDNLSVGMPADHKLIPPEKLPSDYEPTGAIHLRGRAVSGLAGGRTPWWVLISGWTS